MFLNPLMLFAISAVSVPIIIHLLNRRRFERVVWAAMRFLNAAIDQNQRRVRIEDLLLLLVRCLILAAIAVAMARPTLHSPLLSIFGQAKIQAVIVLDNSYSMSATDGVQVRFDQARKAAQDILSSLPPGSSAAILFGAQGGRGSIIEPTFDLLLARQTVDQAALCDRPADLLAAAQTAALICKTYPSPRQEIYLITDGQVHKFEHAVALSDALAQARNQRVAANIFLVGQQEDQNLAVSDLTMNAAAWPIVDQPLRFSAAVTNFGKNETRDVHVTISLDQDAPVAEADIELLAVGETRLVPLDVCIRQSGFHTVTVRIPHDHLPADDQRTLAVNVLKQLNVLLVSSDARLDSRDSSLFYLKHALSPFPASQQASAFVNAKAVGPVELETTRLNDFQVVILANVADFSDSAVVLLAQFVRDGGGLMIFPGPNTNAKFYNQQLFQKLALLPAALGETRGVADAADPIETLQTRDYHNPIVDIWDDPRSGTLGSIKFYKVFDLIPPTADATTPAPRVAGPTAGQIDSLPGPVQTVLDYKSGKPAIMQRQWGAGEVFLFSSTANTAWNDGPAHPAFIPLLYRTFGSVVLRQDDHLNIPVGQPFALRVSNALLDKDATILRPGQSEKTAGRDLQRIEAIDAVPTLAYDQTDLAGPYAATIAADPPVDIKFAVQGVTVESKPDLLSQAQKNRLAANALVMNYTPNMNLAERLEKARVGTELWPYFVFLALALAGLETILADWFSQAK